MGYFHTSLRWTFARQPRTSGAGSGPPDPAQSPERAGRWGAHLPTTRIDREQAMRRSLGCHHHSYRHQRLTFPDFRFLHLFGLPEIRLHLPATLGAPQDSAQDLPFGRAAFAKPNFGVLIL